VLSEELQAGAFQRLPHGTGNTAGPISLPPAACACACIRYVPPRLADLSVSGRWSAPQ